MLKRVHKTQPNIISYQVNGKESNKDVFSFFGLLNPKQLLRKSCKAEGMSSLQRDNTLNSRISREGSFNTKNENYYRQSTANVLRQLLYLVLHLILLLTVLSSAALLFANIEDPNLAAAKRFNRTTKDFEVSKILKTKYNITFTRADLESLLNEMDLDWKIKNDLPKAKINDRVFVFKKWFYFASIASTTIGYGDITPVTRDGRITFIIFIIIAIPLMLSFIVSCGDKLGKLVTGLLSMFKQCVAEQQSKASSFHLLTSLIIFILFAGHFSVGCALYLDTNQWTLVDKIYHHFATFSTVGFSDVIAPIEAQVGNVIPLFFYRVFGLILLYAGLESLHSWYEIRKEAFAVRKLIRRPLKSRRKLSAVAYIKSKTGKDEPKLESTMLI